MIERRESKEREEERKEMEEIKKRERKEVYKRLRGRITREITVTKIGKGKKGKKE